MTPQESLVAEQHKRWLDDPITRFQLAKAQESIDKLMEFVLDRSTADLTTDAKLRLHLVSANSARVTLQNLKDTNLYVENHK